MHALWKERIQRSERQWGKSVVKDGIERILCYSVLSQSENSHCNASHCGIPRWEDSAKWKERTQQCPQLSPGSVNQDNSFAQFILPSNQIGSSSVISELSLSSAENVQHQLYWVASWVHIDNRRHQQCCW